MTNIIDWTYILDSLTWIENQSFIVDHCYITQILSVSVTTF